MYDIWVKEGVEPVSLQDKPDLLPWVIEHYKAFRILSTRRPVPGMGGICPISMADILAYMQIYGTEDEEFFVAMILAADGALIRHILKVREATSKAKDAASKNHGR